MNLNPETEILKDWFDNDIGLFTGLEEFLKTKNPSIEDIEFYIRDEVQNLIEMVDLGSESGFLNDLLLYATEHLQYYDLAKMYFNEYKQYYDLAEIYFNEYNQ